MKRALVIDAGFGDLVASAASAACMRACLEARGFAIHALGGAAATVAEIEAWLAGPRCAELGPGDALVVYFVGHGHVARDEAYARDSLDRAPDLADLWFLITQDILDPGAALAGMSGIELTGLLQPIAEATGNVTVILDCCHATGMLAAGSRGAPSQRVREALRRVNLAIRSKCSAHRSRSFASVEPGIVCLVAVTRSETAVEGERHGGGGEIGLFTEAVVAALALASADALTWDEHVVVIRARVMGRCPTQRPGVEGLRYRFPFSLEEREPDGSHACAREADGRLLLRAGLVHGVDYGDRFELVFAEDPSRRLGEAWVGGLGVELATLEGEDGMDPGDALLRARPLQRARLLSLALRGFAESEVERLWAAIPGRVGVGPVRGGERADAVLERDGGGLWLRHAGELVHVDAAADDAASRERLLRALDRVAHVHRIERGLRALTAIGGAPAMEVCWGRGEAEILSGAVLRHVDSVWVHVRPRLQPELHVSAFHLRGDRSVVHLTGALDHGRTCMRECVTDLTQTASGERLCWSLGREAGHWDAHPVRESIVLLASSRAIGLHDLATSRGAVRGGTPKLALAGAPPAVLRLDFLLAP